MSNKRSFNQIVSGSDTNEPSLKRQKPGSDQHHPQSLFFTHKLDKEQYQQIYNAIDNSQIIQSLHITQDISRNIAEFANGQFKSCANPECNNDISILNQDAAIYNNNHENANKIGYKCCRTGHLFCSDCMDLTTECNCIICTKDKPCGSLIVSGNKCYSCTANMAYTSGNPTPDCEFEEWICGYCGQKYCGDCNEKGWACVNCHNLTCEECCVVVDEEYGPGEYGICYGCLDDETVIECKKCNVIYELWYEHNCYLHPVNTDLNLMNKCRHKNCDEYVCLNCDAKDQIGKKYFCQNFGCNDWCDFSASFCNQHVPKQAFCSGE